MKFHYAFSSRAGDLSSLDLSAFIGAVDD